MYCYNCQEKLSREDYCIHCGADVRLYKKITSASNLYYNEGLAKANERDLSGAIESLKKSLKCNKENMQARNLLGLLYYECGDVVAALSEWVISKSFEPDENRATQYIKDVQQNESKLETINQTIKKYNQALVYCKNGSYDLAIIQLKKVLSNNPKLVKAHQLLALLYMQQENYEMAKRYLRSAAHIDVKNEATSRYLEEIKSATSTSRRKKKEKDSISYQRGNDTIIQPTSYREHSALWTVLSFVGGLAIGAVIIFFLVVPGIKNSVMNDASDSVKQANSALASKNATVSSLQEQIESLNTQIEEYQSDEKQSASTVSSYESLLDAYIAWKDNDEDTLTEVFDKIDKDKLGKDYQTIYDEISDDVNEKVLSESYSDGIDAYDNKEYDTAIEELTKATEIDETYKDGKALFYLGMAYEKNGDTEKAKTTYETIISKFENTSIAKKAQTQIDGLEETSTDGNTENNLDEENTTD